MCQGYGTLIDWWFDYNRGNRRRHTIDLWFINATHIQFNNDECNQPPKHIKESFKTQSYATVCAFRRASNDVNKFSLCAFRHSAYENEAPIKFMIDAALVLL